MAISARQIDDLLPQTQCRQCGFNGCLPYAEAIAAGQSDINRCPPGGAAGIVKLAALLGVAAKPLDPQCGSEQPRQVAVINEADCIGCTKCLPPCPTDAIIGASKHLHSVIAELCTGCGLCVAPCPVNCIEMHDSANPDWSQQHAEQARRRYRRKHDRLQRWETEKKARLQRQKMAIKKAIQ